jgi:hypothetical protein
MLLPACQRQPDNAAGYDVGLAENIRAARLPNFAKSRILSISLAGQHDDTYGVFWLTNKG